MKNDNSNPLLTDVTFQNNSADSSGGGMENYNSSPSLTNVTFSANSASSAGGGMRNNDHSSPTLTNVIFIANTSSLWGGGVYNDLSSLPTFINATFSSNTSQQRGGGMYNASSSAPNLTNVTFSANESVLGGAIFNKSSNPRLTNATIVNNSSNFGGGIYNIDSSPIIINSIFWDNIPDQVFNDAGGVAVITYSDIQGGYTGESNLNLVPLLGLLSPNGGFTQTHALLAGSPVIDKANTDACLLFDQRYYTRPVDGDADGQAVCDMGSYEFASTPVVFTLTVTEMGGGSVTAIPDKPGYQYEEVISLNALADPGWSFAGWSGDASGLDNPLSVTMRSDKDITATFTQDEYALTVSTDPSWIGSVTISPVKPNYAYGDKVTLTAAVTQTGWRFTGWSGDATGVDNPVTVTIAGNTSIVATFSDQYTLTTNVDPADAGTVTRNLNPDTYTYGTQVALTANPKPGWTFTGWSGDVTSTNNPLTVTIEVDTTITANFTPIEYTLTVEVAPFGTGTVTLNPDQATYHYGDEVILTATPGAEWAFSGWSGDLSSAENPFTIMIIGNTNITANFGQIFRLYLPLVLKN